MGFVLKDGVLHCEQRRVSEIVREVGTSPFYLYSLARLTRNYRCWEDALAATPSEICFAVKANANINLLKHLRDLGCGATLVSGNELRMALAAGFDPKTLLFNGNGKTVDELVPAIERHVRVNADSEFDLVHIEQAAAAAGRVAEVLIRINPDIDPEVHPYVSTGMRISKFGVREERLSWFLDRIHKSDLLRLAGVHCHLGSTINDVAVFGEAASHLARITADIRAAGHEPDYFNIGGGLGIDYERTHRASSPDLLVAAVRPALPEGMTLVVEPGRSIVGDAAVLIARVIGVKSTGRRRFIVVDGSMAELIRPSLYNAYHEIGFAEPDEGPLAAYDIVGPVCESADFLGKDRRLPKPKEGAVIVVYDVGAYGYAMSSNYNARMRPAEYLVDGDDFTCIRRAETIDDHMRLFEA